MACNSHLLLPPLFILCIILFTSPVAAFGAGFVAPGTQASTSNFRHGDIVLAIPILATCNRRIAKQIYFGNWLRDFSQLLDKSSLSVVPRPLLRALVAVFAFVQFGYATRTFEVTDERLGLYRPEEHVDNPRGYEGNLPSNPTNPEARIGRDAGYQISEGLRPAVHTTELDIDPATGMKNYIANPDVGAVNPTSAQYVEKQLIAAIACGRVGDEEAYVHLGAALHTLEDFMAHSNYVELAMLRVGKEMKDQSGLTPALSKIFTYVGGAAKVRTETGSSAPITTGTFGALDLYQTLLGEIDDKLAAMSLPGLRARTSEKGGALQGVAKTLIAVIGGLTPSFETDILKLQKAAASPKQPTWGAVEEQPEILWKSLEPLFKVRDDIVRWVYDNLTVRAVQDALAAISAAIDKFVYMLLGIFLGPLLSEFSKHLKDQEQALLVKDENVRLSKGHESIFEGDSSASDPTHSQLAKDHYDNVLNSVAGRVAVRISSYTVNCIVQLWQPGNTTDPIPTIRNILSAFHHPNNGSPSFPLQMEMYTEISNYVRTSLTLDPISFANQLQHLTAASIATHSHTHATLPGTASHVEHLTALHAPNAVSHQTAHDLVTTTSPVQQRNFTERLSDNVESEFSTLSASKSTKFSSIKDLLFAPPSSDEPNPIDAGLALLPGLSFTGAFKGINIHEIAAVEGMSETLKDAVVSLILIDEKRGENEEDWAIGRWNASDVYNDVEREKERKREERRKLRVLRELLDVKDRRAKDDEIEGGGNGSGKGGGIGGKMDLVKDKLQKIKLKAEMR